MNEYQRRKEIGDYGEMVACEQLAKNGWQNCIPIGGNNPCFDIEAYKGGQKHLFAVKARNHTTYTGDRKTDYYNLFFSSKPNDPNAKVQEALRIAHNQNAIPMWATVTFDAVRQILLWICCGRVAELKDKRYVPMSPSDILKYPKLAENVFDPRIKPEWSNVRRKPRS